MLSINKWLIITFLYCLALSPQLSQAMIAYIHKERPAVVKLPHNYDPSRAYPLVMLLHGYGSGAAETLFYMEASLIQSQYDFIILAPEGTINKEGRRFWNATPECCAPQDSQVDDSSYLQALIVEVQEKFSVDLGQIYVMGVSNGGFMAYRLACDSGGLFAGIVSITGAMYADNSLCKPYSPVSVLQIHGTHDELVPYEKKDSNYPGAMDSVEFWVSHNKCEFFAEEKNSLDLVLRGQILGFQIPSIDDEALVRVDKKGDEHETDSLIWSQCLGGSKVGLWKMNGATHVPDYSGKNLIGKALEFFKG